MKEIYKVWQKGNFDLRQQYKLNLEANKTEIYFCTVLFKGKTKVPQISSADAENDEETFSTQQRVGVRCEPRAATISPPPIWSDHLLHHQKRQSRLRSNWPSMPRLVI